MGFAVTLLNRQRMATIDKAWFEQTTARLSEMTCQNLVTHAPKHLPASLMKKIAARGSLSLTLVSNRQIRCLNRQWRSKDAATDVLSFPLNLEAPPAGLPWEIGEVIISVEKAIEQADSLGHSIERELAFLFVHGCLHILGFDHQTAREEKEMFKRQNEILAAADICR